MERRVFFIRIILVICSLFFLGFIIYVIDPEQQFRYNKNYVSGEQRVINLGLAKNYDYRTVIIGTSTSENILKKDVDDIFNTNSINLSMMGATAYEQRRVLKKVIKSKKEKDVIYGLDYFSYNWDIFEERENVVDYTQKKNTFKYLYNISTLEKSLKIIAKEFLGKNSKNWIEKWSYWGDEFKYSKEETLSFNKNTKNGRQNIGQIEKAKEGFKLKNAYKNLELLEEVIKENKNIKYKIYLPPYSSLYWYILKRYGSLEEIKKFREILIKKLLKYKNIEIYDFQQELDIVSDLDNYKDAIHYKPEINKLIIEKISKNECKIERFEGILEEKLFENDKEEMERLLKEFEK